MKVHETAESVPGILRPFKSFLESRNLPPGSQIVYYGVPGTCTPFIELLGFAIRTMPIEQVFVPLTSEEKARRIEMKSDIGMQVSGSMVKPSPAIIVLMGGLSMPNSTVNAAQMKSAIERYQVPLVGVCFMKMFEKTGWLKVFDFDLLIDANIAPVDIWRESR